LQVTDQNGNTVNGANLLSQPLNSSLFTMAPAGTVNILANGEVTSALLLGPGTQANVFSFNLSAQNDDIRITDIYVSLTGINSVQGNDRVASVQLMSGSTVIANGSKFTSGFRFNLGDSSTEVIKSSQTKTYTVRVQLNSPSNGLPGSYAATGLQLTLGTG
jgi:hypothetical protein